MADLETEIGEMIASKESVKDLHKQWMGNRGKVEVALT
jgi:hypothetical protein